MNMFDDEEDDGGDVKAKVQVRMKQRNGKKSVTTVEGMHPQLDYPRLLRAMKRQFQCNGSIQEDKKGDKVLQFSGDQRANVRDFILSEEMYTSGEIILHGY